MGIELDWCAPEACSLNPADQPAPDTELVSVLLDERFGFRFTPACTPNGSGAALEPRRADRRRFTVVVDIVRGLTDCHYFSLYMTSPGAP